ncbi:MAG: class I SAM-dependent methyltransferase [Chloroflexota bacterium]
MTEWNAQAYNRLNSPMQTWGEAIVGRLDLRGDETTLDLGCGSGRLTEFLLDKLPRGRVIAIDRSANMLESARSFLEPRYSGRVEYVQASLDEIEFSEVADVAFSNAAFHWVKDHPRLLAAIFRGLKPGGWLVAQCGAEPNIARVRARVRDIVSDLRYGSYFAGWDGPWEFASPERMTDRLRAAGFEDIFTEMFEAPVQLGSAAETRDYFENVILGTHLARIPDSQFDLRLELLDRMTAASAADDPPFRQDYWRLNVRARRPAR